MRYGVIQFHHGKQALQMFSNMFDVAALPDPLRERVPDTQLLLTGNLRLLVSLVRDLHFPSRE